MNKYQHLTKYEFGKRKKTPSRFTWFMIGLFIAALVYITGFWHFVTSYYIIPKEQGGWQVEEFCSLEIYE